MGKHRERETSQRTIDNRSAVHLAHQAIREEAGIYYADLSKESIYRRIAERTGYCTKQVAYILNHTKMSEPPTG